MKKINYYLLLLIVLFFQKTYGQKGSEMYMNNEIITCSQNKSQATFNVSLIISYEFTDYLRPADDESLVGQAFSDNATLKASFQIYLPITSVRYGNKNISAKSIKGFDDYVIRLNECYADVYSGGSKLNRIRISVSGYQDMKLDHSPTTATSSVNWSKIFNTTDKKQIINYLRSGFELKNFTYKLSNPIAYRTDGLCQQLKELDKENEYDDLISQADDYYLRDQYKEAKSIYSKALRIKPNENYPKEKIKAINLKLEELSEKEKEKVSDNDNADNTEEDDFWEDDSDNGQNSNKSINPDSEEDWWEDDIGIENEGNSEKLFITIKIFEGKGGRNERRIFTSEPEYFDLCKYGYIDNKGKLKIDYIYENAVSFSEGLAAVINGDKWGFINTTGELVIDYNYDNILLDYNFSEGLALVLYGNKLGYINKTGEIVIDIKYRSCKDFSEGLAAVYNGYDWGYINKTGELVIDFKFNKAGNFSDGLALVEKPYSKQYFINKFGKTIISNLNDNGSRKYKEIKDFSEGLAPVENWKSKWGYVNINDEKVISFLYDEAGKFSEGLAAVVYGGKWGFINKKGELIIDYKYYSVLAGFSNGLAIVKKDNNSNYIYIDKTGKKIADHTIIIEE